MALRRLPLTLLGGLLLWAPGCVVSFDGYELEGDAGVAGADSGVGGDSGSSGAPFGGASGGPTGGASGSSGAPGGSGGLVTGGTSGSGGVPSGGTGGLVTGGSGGATGGTGGVVTGGTGGVVTGGTGGTGGVVTGGTGGGTGGSPATCPGGMVKITAATPFCVDATEVVESDYQLFLLGGNYPPDHASCPGNNTNANLKPVTGCGSFNPVGSLPVVCIDWCDAQAYCTKRGKRLCGKIGGGAVASNQLTNASQSEWYNACSNGGTTLFPYGDIYAATKCNGLEGIFTGLATASQLSDCSGPLGIYNMSGNAVEWEDGCNGSNCPQRGGAYLDSNTPYSGHPDDLTCKSAIMVGRMSVSKFRGFRCCADPS
ncbi:MAG: SUMF1/EgtB/PvdO family nonheme iron enzyme [Polyangiaceae bacterium]